MAGALLGVILCIAAGWWASTQRVLPLNELRSLDNDVLEKRAERGPDRVTALCILGERLRAGRIPAEALEPYQAALKLEPNNAQVVAGYVMAKGAQVSPGWVDVVLRELIRVQPTHYAGFLALGDLYTREGELERASPFLREALRLNPNDAEVHYQYGLWSATIGATGKGIEHLDAACRLSPRVARYRIGLADLQIHLASYLEARRNLEIAEALDPGSATVKYHQARLLLAGKSTPSDRLRAVQYLEEARKLAPDWDLPQLTLGRHLIQNGDPERGVQILESLLDHGPDKQLLATLAQGYYRLGKQANGDHLIKLYQKALDASRREDANWLAAKRSGTNIQLKLRRARRLQMSGRDLQALNLYRDVLIIDPGNAESKKAIDELTRQAN